MDQLPVVIENKKFRDQFYKGVTGLVKYVLAANLSSDALVLSILNHLADLLSTARRLFRIWLIGRFFSWYSLYPKIIKSFSEEKPTLFAYLRNVCSPLAFCAECIAKNEKMKKHTQYLAAAFQSSALFFLLTQNFERFFEVRDSQVHLKYETIGDTEKARKAKQIEWDYFVLFLDVLKNISNFMGCLTITIPSLLQMGRKRLALTSVTGGFIGAYLTFLDVAYPKGQLTGTPTSAS